jgi:hypothetical protein
MTQGNLLPLAKQGDVKSISSLINHSLNPKGITAKVALKEGCLQVMLESTQVPPQKVLFEFVRKGITSLDIASLQKVEVYGRKTGEEFWAWSQEFEIGYQQSPVPSSISDQSVASSRMIQQKQPSLKERAKQGDVDAITQLLNIALQHKNITVKASLKEGCLQVKLECEQIPEQTSATLIRREIIMLKIEFIKTVKIYAQQKDNDFPEWIQEFELIEFKNPQTYTSRNNTQNLIISFNENTLGILGSIILLTGVFAPIISAPVIGTLNYFNNGKGDGVILLVLAVISLVLTFKENYKFLWWTGTASFGVIIIGLINFLTQIYQLQSNIEERLAGNPFKGLADAAVQSVQLQWGWIPLIMGASMIIAAAAISEKSNISQTGYKQYFYELLNFKKAQKPYVFLFLVLLGIFIPKIFIEIKAKTEYENQATKARQSEGKTFIGSMNRGHQAYYIENDKFAPTIEDLSIGIPSETSSYKYSIFPISESQTVTEATAKKDGLKSYIGIVLAVKDTEYGTTATICESNKPTKVQPEIPPIINNEVQCPSDYSKLEH